MFSSEFETKSYLVKKKRILMVTTLHVFILGRNKHKVKACSPLAELYAITKSLLIDNYKFILHFKNTPD